MKTFFKKNKYYQKKRKKSLAKNFLKNLFKNKKFYGIVLHSQSNNKFYIQKDVPAYDFIREYAEFLKKNNKIKIPEWGSIVKTGVGKELAPLDPDWIYVRAAALARKVYVRGHWGVGNLSHLFGTRKRNDNMREKHSAGSRKVIRYLLQQLEAIKVVSRDKNSELKKFSRVITKEGQQDLNRIATQVALKARAKK
ncbi:hypothetical protein pb186bvf_016593 [Paramecium bursaria]